MSPSWALHPLAADLVAEDGENGPLAFDNTPCLFRQHRTPRAANARGGLTDGPVVGNDRGHADPQRRRDRAARPGELREHDVARRHRLREGQGQGPLLALLREDVVAEGENEQRQQVDGHEGEVEAPDRLMRQRRGCLAGRNGDRAAVQLQQQPRRRVEAGQPIGGGHALETAVPDQPPDDRAVLLLDPPGLPVHVAGLRGSLPGAGHRAVDDPVDQAARLRLSQSRALPQRHLLPPRRARPLPGRPGHPHEILKRRIVLLG